MKNYQYFILLIAVLSILRFDNTKFWQHISSNAGVIENLLQAHIFSRSQPGFSYQPVGFPITENWQYNSGSIISGLLHYTNLHPGGLSQTAHGWNNPVPASFFGG